MQKQATAPEIQTAITRETTSVSLWRARGIAALRILFGLIWAIDAYLKWQPGFIKSFMSQITGAKQGQAQSVQAWITFWGHVVGSNPSFFAYFTAAMETALALLLIAGLLTNLTCVVGIVWSIGIWAIPEGFGGPYQPGQSTDIGTAILYAVMFAILLAIAAGRYYAIDRWLTPRLGPLGFLASGRLRRRTAQ